MQEVLEWMQDWARRSPDYFKDHTLILLLGAAQKAKQPVVVSRFAGVVNCFFGATADAEDVQQMIQRAEANGLVCIEGEAIALTEELGETVCAILRENPDAVRPQPGRGDGTMMEAIEQHIIEWGYAAMEHGTYERDRDLVLALGFLSQLEDGAPIHYRDFRRVLGALWSISCASGSIVRAIARAEKNGLVTIDRPPRRRPLLDCPISLTELGHQFCIALLDNPDVDAVTPTDVAAARRMVAHREADGQGDVQGPYVPPSRPRVGRLSAFPLVLSVASYTEFVEEVFPPARVYLHAGEDGSVNLQGVSAAGLIVWLREPSPLQVPLAPEPAANTIWDQGAQSIISLLRNELKGMGYSVGSGKLIYPLFDSHLLDGYFIYPSRRKDPDRFDAIDGGDCEGLNEGEEGYEGEEQDE